MSFFSFRTRSRFLLNSDGSVAIKLKARFGMVVPDMKEFFLRTILL